MAHLSLICARQMGVRACLTVGVPVHAWLLLEWRVHGLGMAGARA
jgi:hypothetical protein